MVIFRSFNNLILNESPNIFQWKPAKKQSSCSRGKNFLGQIRSNVVKKSKESGIINRFLSYFACGIPFKAKSSGCPNTLVKI